MTLRATRDTAKGTITLHCTYGPVTFQVTEHRGHALVFWHQLGALVIEDTEDRAREGYARYVVDCGGVSVHGEPLPAWEAMDEKIRGHWIAAFTE